MRYTTSDGKSFEAESPEDLAEQLRQSRFTPEATLEEWMEGSARRARNFNDAVIRTDTVAHHIEDLVQNGFLRRED